MKLKFGKNSTTPILSIGLLISTAPRMLELFAHYSMTEDLKDFMIGMGVAMVLGAFIVSRLKPSI